ncbi:MAG: class I SAM-dependent methyltransferase [Devosia sp.]|uniref:class I SAM-dependent DNA methyltransferase n=1 Tax=Devosia sp. TaxID=1871048 RepID=UPI0024CB3499|nr:class I SAM-dependent methyltransferase [Devosia sp.]UYO00955.1 MAG: class I SAM-dependent methyltransferase [Devosia sp.]
MSSLYDDAGLYDLVAPPDAAMERYYVDNAGGPGRRVLELACGTGRFTVRLAASGADVTGADLSATMLAGARQRLTEQGLRADLIELDMRGFDLGVQFDAVVVAANSLMHLHTQDDFTRAMSSIRRHLAPGGVFAFDVFVPSARLLGRPPDQRHPLGTFAREGLGPVVVEETVSYDPITQISRADWYWSTNTQRDFRHTRLDLRQIYPQELPMLLGLGGLKLAQRYGDFALGTLTPQSFRQVCLAVLD